MTNRILVFAVLLYGSLLTASLDFDGTETHTQNRPDVKVEDRQIAPLVKDDEDLRNVCEEVRALSPIVPQSESILLIGDSLAVGMSSGFERVAKDAGYVPRVHAISGTNTRQWIPLLSRDILDLKPKLVVASLGTNDAVAYPTWLEKNSDMYTGLVNVADTAGVPLVWIAPPPSSSPKIQSVKEVCEYIEATGVEYFDTSSLEIQKADDQIHFTPLGYSKTIDSVWLWMASRNIVASTSAR